MRLNPHRFGMIRLGPSDAIPAAALSATNCFIARTATELSIVARLATVEALGVSAGTFRLIGIAATFGTTETGILKRIVDPLAAAGVWILALGTHDTDYVLVREDQCEVAVEALCRAGHQFVA